MEKPILLSSDWVIRGAEKNLAPPYNLLEGSQNNTALYAYYTKDRTAEQVISLEATEAFLSDFIESENDHPAGTVFTLDSGEEEIACVKISVSEYQDLLAENGEPENAEVTIKGQDVLIEFQSVESAEDYIGQDADIEIVHPSETLTITDGTENIKLIHYPYSRDRICYLPDDNGGWYILCGEVKEDDTWNLTTFALRVEKLYRAVMDALNDELVVTIPNLAYCNYVKFLRQLFEGYHENGKPYIKVKKISRERWILVDEDEDNLTGVAYESAMQAISVAMRLCEFCGIDKWKEFRDETIVSVQGLSISGFATAGSAVTGKSFETVSA